VPAGDLAVVVAVVTLAATIQLSAGFGLALAAVPLMSLAIDPHDAVIITLGVATLTNGFQAWTGRVTRDGGVALRMIAGAAVGLPIGLALFLAADDQALGIAIGVAVLATVVSVARGVDLSGASPALDVGSGVAAGALTTSVGTNGPPLVFVLQARQFTPERFRATITTVFVVLDVTSMIVFAAVGELTGDLLLAILLSLPGLVVGAMLGIRIAARLDPRLFRRVVMVLLTVAAVSALTSAALA
jgi:uncharacterized membrane protein YfcA